MRLRALLCIPAGHHWQADPDSYEVEPILRCTRCGRRLDVGAETRGITPWLGRRPSGTGAITGQTGRDGRPM